MKTSANLTILSVLGAIASIAPSPVSASDEICGKLAEFALATPQNTTQSIEIRNDWSNFSKYCAFNDYEPGKVFCSWLNSNTSTEFMHANVSRVLTCLSSESTGLGIPSVTPDYITGKYTSYSARNLSADYEVSIEYAVGISGQLDTLKISVTKEDLE